jgi:hypothetical protein
MNEAEVEVKVEVEQRLNAPHLILNLSLNLSLLHARGLLQHPVRGMLHSLVQATAC